MSIQEMRAVEIEHGLPEPYPLFKQAVTPSEVPLEFHPFAFLTLISAIIGDRVYFVEGIDRIHPNLWTLHVGESSVSRKSTAIRPVLEIVGELRPACLLASKGSPEGLFEEIVEAKGVGLLNHTELGALLGALRRDYMRGLTEELCEYYDPSAVGIRKRLVSTGASRVERLAISWIAATTQASLKEHLISNSNRIATGFLPRFNIVFGTDTARLVPFRQARDDAKWEELLGRLKELDEGLGEVPTQARFSREALDRFSEWYIPTREGMRGAGMETDGVIGYFWIRTFEVVKKYAVILAVLKGSDMVDEASMQQATQIGNYFLATSRRLIEEELPHSRQQEHMSNVLAKIKGAGGKVTRRQLLRSTRLLLSELKPLLETLEERGDIEVGTEGKTHWITLKDGED